MTHDEASLLAWPIAITISALLMAVLPAAADKDRLGLNLYVTALRCTVCTSVALVAWCIYFAAT